MCRMWVRPEGRRAMREVWVVLGPGPCRSVSFALQSLCPLCVARTVITDTVAR